MTNKIAALLVAAFAFGVYFIDNLYKLGSLEWLPDVLGPILITATIFIWNPGRAMGRDRDETLPPEDKR